MTEGTNTIKVLRLCVSVLYDMNSEGGFYVSPVLCTCSVSAGSLNLILNESDITLTSEDTHNRPLLCSDIKPSKLLSST